MRVIALGGDQAVELDGDTVGGHHASAVHGEHMLLLPQGLKSPT